MSVKKLLAIVLITSVLVMNIEVGKSEAFIPAAVLVAPEVLPYVATALVAAGLKITTEDAMSRFADAFAEWSIRKGRSAYNYLESIVGSSKIELDNVYNDVRDFINDVSRSSEYKYTVASPLNYNYASTSYDRGGWNNRFIVYPKIDNGFPVDGIYKYKLHTKITKTKEGTGNTGLSFGYSDGYTTYSIKIIDFSVLAVGESLISDQEVYVKRVGTNNYISIDGLNYNQIGYLSYFCLIDWQNYYDKLFGVDELTANLVSANSIPVDEVISSQDYEITSPEYVEGKIAYVQPAEDLVAKDYTSINYDYAPSGVNIIQPLPGLKVISTTENSISLDWDDVPGAVNYRIFTSDIVITSTTSDCVISNLEPARRYDITIQAYDDIGTVIAQGKLDTYTQGQTTGLLTGVVSAINSLPVTIANKLGIDLTETEINTLPMRNLALSFTTKFPFSIPWDLKKMITVPANQVPETFSFAFPYTSQKFTVPIPPFLTTTATWIRTGELILFAIGLALLTKNLVGG